ncbi:MAG: hypothetical protein CVV05_18530 [Gammaproteobacteria bacterium HGW-Gammaproteobacteria-1]|jgi:hypothetical protein|nr:MAG: hypothetical protein CVV05_18530 [Gammaproteobacteria bacterium HGW-Gammaproteobacteria-1]
MNGQTDTSVPGQTIAVAAEALYLANLLLLPGFSFALLLWLFFRHRRNGAPLARCHLRQTVAASLWAGVILVIVNVLILATGGYQSANVWMYVIIYFTVGHSSLILLGMVGLAKAMAGRAWRYPIIGMQCDE